MQAAGVKQREKNIRYRVRRIDITISLSLGFPILLEKQPSGIERTLGLESDQPDLKFQSPHKLRVLEQVT